MINPFKDNARLALLGLAFIYAIVAVLWIKVFWPRSQTRPFVIPETDWTEFLVQDIAQFRKTHKVTGGGGGNGCTSTMYHGDDGEFVEEECGGPSKFWKQTFKLEHRG